MRKKVVMHTGYFIFVQSGDFAAQAYHTILYQWMHVSKAQGVPKQHVLASLTKIEGITLAHPKPSLTGAKLFAPRE
jgi:hypothetical protein